MTSPCSQTTRSTSRNGWSISSYAQPGFRTFVTCLDHDANVSPWVCLEERGAKVRTADIKMSDCTLDMFDLQATILHCLGVDHTRLTYKFKGRHFRLTDVAGDVVKEILRGTA